MHILLQTLSMPHAMLLNRVESANPPQQPKKKRLTGPELEDYLLFQSPGNKRIMYENRHQHPLVKDMLYTDGVKLACEGSPVLDELKALEAKGVRLILCQTCLNTFGLTDKVRVGIVGGMSDIITAMWQADSVITV